MREEAPKWAGPPLGACGTKDETRDTRLVGRKDASLRP